MWRHAIALSLYSAVWTLEQRESASAQWGLGRWLKRAERTERVPRPLHIYRAIRRTASKSVGRWGEAKRDDPKELGAARQVARGVRRATPACHLSPTLP